MREVLRSERKFLLNMLEASSILHDMNALLHLDSHAGVDGYTIRSLYFDSWDDKDYRDKVDGLENKRKVRLRIYSPRDEYAYLEMKQKTGALQKKRSLKITRQHALEMIEGNYTSLLSYDEAFAKECYTHMQAHLYRPKTIVEYQRTPFVLAENNIRLTLDSRISATESCFDLFSGSLNLNPVMDLDNILLEVKYNGFLLSYVQEILNKVDRNEVALSKYILARQNSFLTAL